MDSRLKIQIDFLYSYHSAVLCLLWTEVNDSLGQYFVNDIFFLTNENVYKNIGIILVKQIFVNNQMFA